MEGLPHDYVCRAQLNGDVMIGMQINKIPCDSLDTTAEAVPWTPTGNSSDVGDTAIIVRVEGYTREDIATWPLSKFIRFPRKLYQYDWTQGMFSRDLGRDVLNYYQDILSHSGDPLSQAIWKTHSDQKAWLVNFSPEAFSLFVQSDTEPTRIHSEYWCELFRNRHWIVPSSKRAAHEIITRNYSSS